MQPRTFHDHRGRRWKLLITAGAVSRVRTDTGVDLADGAASNRLADDPSLLANVLWVLLAGQAGARGMSDEQFGRMLTEKLDGHFLIERAVSALLDAMADYFSNHEVLHGRA